MRRPAFTQAELVAAILVEIERDPGITSNEIARQVPARRQVVLQLVAAMEARGVVESRPGPRGALHRFPLARARS